MFFSCCGLYIFTGPIVERHTKRNSKKNKRKDSMKKYMTPNYNNTNPLDLTDDDDINLYESYDHSEQNLSSYCLEMIEDGLTHSEDSDASNNHIQDDKKRSSSDNEASVQLRKKRDPENEEHDGLKFTERQISTSGLPETIVQYTINQQTAECPLNIIDSRAYENNASHNDKEKDSSMVTGLHISGIPDNDMKTSHSIADKEKRGLIALPEHENDSQTQSIAVYDDNFIPDSVCLEIDKNSTFLTNSKNTALENQSTQESGNTKSSLPTAIYDDAFIPVTNYDENGNIDAPPLYKDTVDCPLVTGEVYDDSLVSFDSSSIKDSADSLPLYEDTDENAKLTLGLSVNATGNPNTNVTATVATQENGPIYKGGEVVSNGETNINDLDVYEDYDMGKLPPYTPPPISKELNTILAQPNLGSNATGNSNTNVTASVASQETGPVYKSSEVVSNGDTNIDDLDVYEDYDMGKLPPSTPPHINKELNTILGQPNFGSSLKDDKNSTDLVFDLDIRNDLTSTGHHPQMVLTSTSESLGTSNVQPQNMNVNTLRLLDLSLEPEKVRSGSKIDIFDEPSMKDSPEKYFVDMKDFTSEIVDNINKDISPVIDEEKSFTIINDSNITSTDNTTDTLTINSFASKVDSEHKTARNNNAVKQAQNIDTVWDQTVQIDHNIAGKTVNCVDLLDVKNSDLLTYDNLAGFEVTKNMDGQQTTKAVNGDNFSDNESEIYDTPPPNFPPPQLQW